MNDDVPPGPPPPLAPHKRLERMFPNESGKVRRFISYRAEGMNEYDALEKAGLKRKKWLLRKIQGNPTVQRAIIRKARQGVNIVRLVEESRGRLHEFINNRALDPNIVLKAIDVFYKSLLNSGVLTLNERATLEQNPSTRVDLARQVLAQLREATLPEAKEARYITLDGRPTNDVLEVYGSSVEITPTDPFEEKDIDAVRTGSAPDPEESP